MTRRTNSEGGIVANRQEEIVEYRKQWKEIAKALYEAKARVKALRGELDEIESKLGFAIDNIHQPDLPFGEGEMFTPGSN